MQKTEAQETAPVLRPAWPEDLPVVLDLLERARLPVAGVEEWFGTFVVAEESGRIIGVAGLEVHGGDGLLRSVAVADEYRGRGLGSALTEAVVALGASEGLRAIYLLTETAEGFFPRHGFTRIEREQASAGVRASEEFRELCPASSALMVRHLVKSA